MNIRIISGILGGRKIVAPDGDITHPMGERQRNSLFNIIKDEIEGAEVLDMFAGTGSLGLETLSRGAKVATFVERDQIAQNAIAKNIETLGLEDRANLVRASASAWLEKNEDKKFDLIFADPPYDDVQFSTVSQIMGLLKPGALMVLSHPGRSESPTRPGVVVVDNRSYGTVALTFYRREDRDKDAKASILM